MKTISASILVLAGAILITGGSRIQHSDTKLFVQIVGCFVGMVCRLQREIAFGFDAIQHSTRDAEVELLA